MGWAMRCVSTRTIILCSRYTHLISRLQLPETEMNTRSSKSHLLSHLRLADPDDADDIHKMMNESICKTFRTETTSGIMYLIENCILSVVQLDNHENVVGFMSLKDYPMMPSVHPIAWEEYVWTKYKSVELNARNSLWLHMLCWQPSFGREVVDNMLRSVFMHDPYVHHIALIKTLIDVPLLMPGQYRAEASFRKVCAVERGISSDLLPPLMIADRTEVCPRLRIRRAVEEDNDDIVPIIENHSERLREIYGEFYISELISRHPESERALLVCEHKELAVGVMCLNTQINYEVLEESFDLSPFAGLKHIEAQAASLARDLDTSKSYSCTYMQTCMDTLDAQGSKHKIKWFEEDADPIEITSALHLYLEQMDLLDFLEDEDDELDYEIVNIADNQLTLPPVMASESHLTFPKSPGHDSVEKEQSKEKRSSRPRLDFIRFEGEPNAFVIELFAIHSEYDERYGFDILEAAFEIFPDRDYCVICLPSNHPSFPLLEHFTLVTPFGNRMRFINEALYVAHKNSVRGDLRVRLTERSDKEDVYMLLEHTQRPKFFMEVFERSLDSSVLCPYFLLSENKPVGLAVLGPLEDSTAIRNQFVLEPEPRRPGTDGIILLGIMSPALEPHTRWFLRELIRQSPYTTLFWVCPLFSKGDTNPIRNLMSLTSQLSPKRCRIGMVNVTGSKETDKYYKEHPGFALWMIERGLTSVPKVHVNNSIVVVGASRTGLAFIETLIIGPAADYLTFTNITLVSEHGLPTVFDCFKAAEMCIPKEGRYTDKYLKCIPFYFYIDVIAAVMKNIDRRKKCIYLKDGSVKYYDELVLTCGKQFQHPDYLTDALLNIAETDLSKPCDRMLLDNPKYLPDIVPDPPQRPVNLFLINSLYDANYCLKKLLAMISEANTIGNGHYILRPNYPIAVYGDCVEAYACMAGLLELGISPKNIIFIEPFPAEDESQLRVNCFNNERVDEKVQAALGVKGIRVYRQCRLSSLKLELNKIVALNLMSAFHHLTLPCFAFFYYGQKAIDLNAFRAINESGLVYDGGLVIGARFDTNDPNVYGAGPCTQYSRRLYANRWSHTHYYSEEVGVALARNFLHKFDPFVVCNKNAKSHELFPTYHHSFIVGDDSMHDVFNEEREEQEIPVSKSTSKGPKLKLPTVNRWEPVIRFESPIVISAHLPGPLFYMKMRRPGRDVPFEVQFCLPKQGHTLLTEKKSNYFRLQLNSLHCVESLTCLSTKHFSSEVFARLYGMHEAFFNKLLIRFTKKKVDDLYDYFVQPWMAVLYQETFDDLMFRMNIQKIDALYQSLTKHFKKEGGGMVCQGLGICCTFERCCCDSGPKPTAIPSDCAQRHMMQAYAKRAWERVDGENIVLCYLARYLDRHSVINPHYARPLSENIPNIDFTASNLSEMLDTD